MARKTSSAQIGAFVLGAIALIVLAVALWGSRSLFERKYEYICYFPGAVTGLNHGAPVKFGGVDIGVVKEIKIRFHQAPDDRRIPVIIEVWGKRLRELGGREPNSALLRELVAKGLRARLDSVSLVTGVMYVRLDLVPDAPAPYAVGTPDPGAMPEIPTLPTQFEQTTEALNKFLANLAKADFKGTSDSISEAMRGVGEITGSEELRGALKELQPLLSSANAMTKTVTSQANRTGDDVRGAVGALAETLDTTKGTLAPEAPLSVELSGAISNVDKAAIAVRELADFLRRNPHSIVAGTKPRGPSQ
jgi:paraquat-inducible protein B